MTHESSLEKYFDKNWYLATYPNIAKANIEPLQHFLKFGLKEGRDANPHFDQHWYSSEYMAQMAPGTPPLLHYETIGKLEGCRPNALLDPDFVRAQHALPPDEDVLAYLVSHEDTVDWINPWFSRDRYLARHPDVAKSPFCPEIHFWKYGIAEGRDISAGLMLKEKSTDSNTIPFENLISEVVIGEQEYQVINHQAPDAIVHQIVEQARTEPDIVAAGLQCLPHLKKFNATDLKKRSRIDHVALFSQVAGPYDAIIIMRKLQVGGAEKYAAQLAWGLSHVGAKSVLIMTTDSTGEDDRAALDLDALSGLRDFKIVSLKDSIESDHRVEMVLALLLLTVKPKLLFVVNGDIGLRAVKAYGRQLGAFTKIFCAFFSESPYAIGAPFSVRYLRDVVLHASILSDNKPALKTWGDRLGGVADDRLVLLPPMVRGIDSTTALAHRQNIAPRTPHDTRQALWISRWDPFKALDVLQEIAKKDPLLTINAFGPVKSPDLAQDLPPNIKMGGVLKNPMDLNVEPYDLMIFTSYFEGMPNIVLEMATLGIPIVASDVGGLRDTFPDGTIKLVAMEGSIEDMADRFLSAANELCAEDPCDRMQRIERTRAAVAKHHGTENFLRTIKKMIGDDHV